MEYEEYYDINSMYNYLMSVAEDKTGCDKKELEGTRHFPLLGWKYAIYFYLRKMGYTFKAIAEVAKKNHSTIINDCNVMHDAIQYNTSESLVAIWNTIYDAANCCKLDKRISTTIGRLENWLYSVSISEEAREKLLGSLDLLTPFNTT